MPGDINKKIISWHPEASAIQVSPVTNKTLFPANEYLIIQLIPKIKKVTGN